MNQTAKLYLRCPGCSPDTDTASRDCRQCSGSQYVPFGMTVGQVQTLQRLASLWQGLIRRVSVRRSQMYGSGRRVVWCDLDTEHTASQGHQATVLEFSDRSNAEHARQMQERCNELETANDDS